MASKAPPIPPDQRASAGDKADVAGSDIGRRDRVTGRHAALIWIEPDRVV